MSREDHPPPLRRDPPRAESDEWLFERTRWPSDRLARGLLQAVRGLLARARPAQVEPSRTLAFGADEGHLALLPHRDLPFALVLRLRDRSVHLGWAALRSDIPAADVAHLTAARAPVDLAHPDAGLEEVLRAIEEELHRPLELRLTWADGEAEPTAVELWLGGHRLLRRGRFSLRALLRAGRLRATARTITLADRERSPVAMHGREGWSLRDPGLRG